VLKLRQQVNIVQIDFATGRKKAVSRIAEAGDFVGFI
jgi:hypothetical protein